MAAAVVAEAAFAETTVAEAAALWGATVTEAAALRPVTATETAVTEAALGRTFGTETATLRTRIVADAARAAAVPSVCAKS